MGRGAIPVAVLTALNVAKKFLGFVSAIERDGF